MYYSYVKNTNTCSVSLQKVEDTVEKLEVELAALLDDIEAPEWRPLLENTGKTAVEILDDLGQRGHS